MNKSKKKLIVNSLTGSRILGTFFLPFLFSILTPSTFILFTSILFFTDFLDGFLARKWKVSTIFGSLLDMSADKMFAFSVLLILNNMYPLMKVLILLESIILASNIMNANKGSIGKSSELGRIKTVIMGISTCTLFLTGMSTEIIQSLNKLHINGTINSIMNFINNNKNIISNITQTALISSETIVAGDYIKKGLDNKKDKSNETIFKILKDKEKLKYIKKILLDEKYYNATKDMNMLNKLNPTEEEKENIKKLILKKEN